MYVYTYVYTYIHINMCIYIYLSIHVCACMHVANRSRGESTSEMYRVAYGVLSVRSLVYLSSHLFIYRGTYLYIINMPSP